MNVAIIGGGEFGRAIASLLEFNDVAHQLITRQSSPQNEIDIALFSVPTQAFRQAFNENKSHFNSKTILINCSKGIEEGTHLLPYQITEQFDVYPHYFALVGPSFAAEVVAQHPTAISIGYKNTTKLNDVIELLETPFFRLHPSSDFKSLELAAALKNVYAILCGYASGLGFGANTQTRLVLDAHKEFISIATFLGYSIKDMNTPGIIGDLILTCTSKQSRNYTYGFELAKQHGIDPNATEKTIEGYPTCHSVNELLKGHDKDFPLAMLTARLANGVFVSPDEFCHIIAKNVS